MNVQKGLYLVADLDFVSSPDRLVQIVHAAVQAGVALVQLRAKNADLALFLHLATRIMAETRPLGVPLIINDNVGVAMAVQAAGVHLGQTDIPVAEARLLLGPEAIIGLSLEHKSQWAQSKLPGLSYIAASPVFSTDTKADIASPLGLEGLSFLVGASPVAVTAIGGINLQNITSVAAAGASHAAVVSAICAAADPAMATRQLVQAFKAGAALYAQ